MASNVTKTGSAHFHHFHLNVTNPAATTRFYRDLLGATEVKYRGVADALFTERSFILFTKVDTPPPAAPTSTLHHMGWAGVDGPSECKWLKDKGVRFQTPATPIGSDHYMYFYGPDDEILEIYTGGKNHRFNHFHLYNTDARGAAQWFVDHLGLQVRRENGFPGIQIDNVAMVFFGAPLPEWWQPEYWLVEKDTDLDPTEGRVIDHVAFSFRNIDPVYDRMERSGVQMVRPIETSAAFGHKSFYVLGPDGLLVEIVEDKPIPEGIWD
ncbi:MAG: VOC family protein [Desulfobacterales bacterium]